MHFLFWGGTQNLLQKKTQNGPNPNFSPALQARIDGAQHPELMKLARLGNHGAQPSHCSRDLVRSLSASFQQLPPISYVKVPVQGHRVQEPLEIDLEVQFPHDVFAHYSNHPQEFQQIFGTDEELQAYWGEKDCQDPAFQFHPALTRQDFRSKCVPVKLHSDGVIMSKIESLHVVSWSSYFGQGKVLETQLLFTAIVKSACLKQPEDGLDTLKKIYRCLRWSLAACLAGLHPALDWDEEPWPQGSQRARLANTPLHPEGKFIGVFQLLGDLDELCNVYGLRHFNSREPCFWCRCTTEAHLPWTDFSPAAAWRQTLEEPGPAGPAMPPPSDNEIWMVPGLSIFSIGWDLLHGCDVGPCLHVLGNCLEDLMEIHTLGRNDAARVGAVWEAAQQLYRAMGIQNRLAHLDLNSWRHGSDQFPRLRAKGNEAKHFLPVMDALLQRFDPGQTLYHRVRTRMVASLLAFYSIVDLPKLLLTPEEARAGHTAIMQFLRDYSWLSSNAMRQGKLRWQLTIKFHYMAHAADLLRWYNPKFSSTYPGESFVGKISKVALSASMGKPAFALGGLLMQKIQASRAVRLRKQLE